MPVTPAKGCARGWGGGLTREGGGGGVPETTGVGFLPIVAC